MEVWGPDTRERHLDGEQPARKAAKKDPEWLPVATLRGVAQRHNSNDSGKAYNPESLFVSGLIFDPCLSSPIRTWFRDVWLVNTDDRIEPRYVQLETRGHEPTELNLVQSLCQAVEGLSKDDTFFVTEYDASSPLRPQKVRIPSSLKTTLEKSYIVYRVAKAEGDERSLVMLRHYEWASKKEFGWWRIIPARKPTMVGRSKGEREIALTLSCFLNETNRARTLSPEDAFVAYSYSFACNNLPFVDCFWTEEGKALFNPEKLTPRASVKTDPARLNALADEYRLFLEEEMLKYHAQDRNTCFVQTNGPGGAFTTEINSLARCNPAVPKGTVSMCLCVDTEKRQFGATPLLRIPLLSEKDDLLVSNVREEKAFRFIAYHALAQTAGPVRDFHTETMHATKILSHELAEERLRFSANTLGLLEQIGCSIPRFMLSLVTGRNHWNRAPQPTLGGGIRLRDYQLETLHAMLQRESLANEDSGGFRGLFWHDLKHANAWFSVVPGMTNTERSGLKRRSDSADVAQPAGGICAEKPGSGKTIIALALIDANRATAKSFRYRAKNAEARRVCRATLVVVPPMILKQWEEESKRVLPHAEIYAKHNNLHAHFDPGYGFFIETDGDWDKPKDPCIVITTYAAVAASYLHGSWLHLHEWHRVIFDESHYLRKGGAWKTACAALRANLRWCLTATPIISSDLDVAHQASTLGLNLQDLEYYPCMRRIPMLTRHRWMHGQNNLQFWCSALFLAGVYRLIIVRHRESRIDGEITLPVPHRQLVSVQFSEAEHRAYSALESLQRSILMSQPQQDKSSRDRLAGLLRIYARGVQSPQEVAGRMQSLSNEVPLEDAENGCPVCSEEMECPVRTKCNHWFCAGCIRTEISISRSCPICKMRIDNLSAVATTTATSPLPKDIPSGTCEAKQNVIVSEVTRLREADETSRFVMMCEFTDEAMLLSEALNQAGIEAACVHGRVPFPARTANLELFVKGEGATVLCMTYRTGACGINLTRANYIFLVDPGPDAASEEQAIGRVVRFGQARQVNIVRMFLRGTMEEDIAKERNA